jgi:membrane protease YdiL (CAAX protease family)
MSTVAPVELPHEGVRMHPLLVSIVLHLFPGVIVFSAYLALLPAVRALGLPSNVALLVAFLGIGAPLLLGMVIRAGRGRHAGLFGAVTYRERGSSKGWVGLVAVLSLWLLAVSSVVAPLEQSLQLGGFFAWVPADLRLADLLAAHRGALTIVFVLSAVANIVVPVAEETYFRGYLLARIPLSPRSAVIANTVLFSLYHIWLPWQFVSRVIGLLPMVAAVERRRSVAIGIAVHVIVNSTGTLALLAMLPSAVD